jgi:ATP-dependent Clp protease ATP-binding subunit ClpC
MAGERTVIDWITTDWTALARNGKLDPLIGREAELQQFIEILCDPSRKSLMLVGMPGVGMSAIVKGLAWRIIEDKVPAQIEDKRLLVFEGNNFFDPTLTSETITGNFQRLLEELRITESLIFFSDMKGFYSSLYSNSVNLRDLLIIALEKREIVCIGTIVPDELAKFQAIEPSLANYFERLEIVESSPDEAVKVMREKKSLYEAYHGVIISDEAIVTAGQLLGDFRSNLSLPGKVVNLIDHACSRLRMAKQTSFRVRRLEAELADISDNLEYLVDDLTDEQLQVMKQEERELSAELARLQEKIRNESQSLRLTAEDIRNTVYTSTN